MVANFNQWVGGRTWVGGPGVAGLRPVHSAGPHVSAAVGVLRRLLSAGQAAGHSSLHSAHRRCACHHTIQSMPQALHAVHACKSAVCGNGSYITKDSTSQFAQNLGKLALLLRDST